MGQCLLQDRDGGQAVGEAPPEGGSLPAPGCGACSGGPALPDAAPGCGGSPGGGGGFLSALLQSSYRVERPGVGEMRHGSEGWRCLETSFWVGVVGGRVGWQPGVFELACGAPESVAPATPAGALGWGLGLTSTRAPSGSPFPPRRRCTG